MIVRRNVFRGALAIEILLAVGLLVGYWRNHTTPVPPATIRQVLFIGNSFTSVNDLPGTVNKLAQSLGNQVDYAMSAPGGYTFSQHVTNQDTLAKITAKKWDYVVLQEQSEMPAFPDTQVNQVTTPYAMQLVNLIHQHDPATKVVFYETWGYKDGDSANCKQLPYFCTYTSMQERLRQSYEHLASTTNSGIALVGEAWKRSRTRHPEINLYAEDGKHPSEAGTYLAACVFYQALFQKSPLGAARLTLSNQQATVLQLTAAAE